MRGESAEEDYIPGRIERRATERDAPNICKDIVADDQRSRNPEPDEAFKDVVDYEMTRTDSQLHIQPPGVATNLETTIKSKVM